MQRACGDASCSLTTEELVAKLEESGEFRILRRLTEVVEYAAPTGASTRTGVYLDTETTGFDADNDKIIELGLLTFEFDTGGAIYRLGEGVSMLEDPGVPLSPEVSAITQLTDEELAGERIVDEEVEELLEGVELVVAHNATFDRPFVEQRLPLFQELDWACSVNDIPWREFGYPSSSLEFLAYRHAFFYDGHRALNDCRAGLELLARVRECGNTGFAYLCESAFAGSVRLWALGAPYESRHSLKERRYRWSREARAWWTDIKTEDHDAELDWLADNIYPERRPLPFLPVSARDRYSNRIPKVPPAGISRR